ncbi:phospholipid/cholesterol/gamma-HCH transport system substrate-binding protein [Thermomonospora echinospora]|uniref:Phospholipid/cholesterol/gamma-HCH transport system substrate-binding protein n=2 Tax=Thermomonospora echinospora TaxID=1992 RepID=A0A1H5Z626_9ACTN|nr:phospholipid/cholesterol/gamma-HCH transport system substrate-binding protein [Thermomonospora echinospora]
MSQQARYRVYGLAMMLVIVLLLVLAVALFNKALTPAVHVKVHTQRAGLQLLPRSDVKVRGLIVGEVRATHATADGAVLDLALDPDKARLIPGGVTARLLPKTLFGEKYVDLQVPAGGGGPAGLRSGAVIRQDTSQAAVEVDQVLNNLLPVLRAVEPAKLNATLNAIATALEGRGDQIGRNLEQVDSLLRKLNPELPTLVYDLKALADVADIYDSAAPDLLQTLRNLNVTSKTITDKRQTIEDLIPAVTGLAVKGDRFMQENGPKVVGFNIANRQVLELFAKYSPSLSCVFEGMVKLQPQAEEAGGGKTPTFNVTVEIVKPRPAYKNPLDLPEMKDHRGPRCYGLPNPKVPSADYLALDGTEDDLWWKDPHDPDEPLPPGHRNRAASGVFVDPGTEMSARDRIKSIVGPLTRTSSDQVSDAAVLLYGPLLDDGSVVTIR